MAYETFGTNDGQPFVWAHGWGQNHAAFLPLAKSFEASGKHAVVDFPGFGQSPPPPGPWGTDHYADFAAEFIKSEIGQPVVWIGHSFGCRVGIQLAARHPDLVKGLFIIAGAGLPRKRPFLKKLYFKGRIALYKFLKKLIPFGLPEDWLRKKFGSADYKNAGPLRETFIKVVNENLSEQARTIRCPVMLVYGMNDTETPPDIGERLKQLIPNSEMVHLQGQDHYSVLGDGRHQVASLLKNFLKKVL